MYKVLFITPFLPSTSTAGQSYSKRLLEDITQNAEVDLICFASKHAPENSILNISNINIKYIYSNKFTKLINIAKIPFLHPIFTCKYSFLIHVYVILKQYKYDYIYFDFSQCSLYSIFIKNKSYLMLHDIIYEKYSRFNGPFQKLILFYAGFSERFILRNTRSKLMTFSQKDSNLLSNIYQLKSEPIDFYLDSRIYHAITDNHPTYFVLYGAWARTENWDGLMWYLTNVFSNIPIPVKHIIIGSGMSEEKRKWLNFSDKIEVLGFVDNPYQLIACAYGLIAPLFAGAGVKVKVIESLACGTPVVGTDIALEGVDIDLPEGALLRANTSEEFLFSINRIINSDVNIKSKIRREFLSAYPRRKFLDILASDANGLYQTK